MEIIERYYETPVWFATDEDGRRCWAIGEVVLTDGSEEQFLGYIEKE